MNLTPKQLEQMLNIYQEALEHIRDMDTGKPAWQIAEEALSKGANS